MAIVFALSMSMPFEVAKIRGLYGGLFGMLGSLLLLPAMRPAIDPRQSMAFTLPLALALATLTNALANGAAFLNLGMDLEKVMWVYYFQGTLRLFLFYIVWAAILMFWDNRLRAAATAGYREEEMKAGRGAKAAADYSPYLAVEEADRRIRLLPMDEINYLRAADDYVEVFTGERAYLRRDTLKSLGEHLNPDNFLRIHRSTIVNLHKIGSLEPISKGDYVIILKNHQRLRASRKYRSELQRRIHGLQ